MSRNRVFVTALIFAVLAGAVALSAETKMRSGEATVYFKSGDYIIDKIIDISSRRHVLETENSGEYPMNNVWMINFIDDAWDFSAERDQLVTDDHYVFLRNGTISAGKIVDFSSAQRIFQFASGESFPIGQVRRIYFSSSVPSSLWGGSQGGGTPSGAGLWVGTYYRQYPKPVEVTLRRNGTAQLSGMQGMTMDGRWEMINAGSIRVILANPMNISDKIVMTFGLDNNQLISLSGALGTNVRLQRR